MNMQLVDLMKVIAHAVSSKNELIAFPWEDDERILQLTLLISNVYHRLN